MHRLFIIVVILSFGFASYSQHRVSISDPEIEFSLEVPKNWQEYDDGYFYYLVIPTRNGDEHLSITYLETDDESPDENFEFSMKQFFPLNEPGYQLIETGNDQIDGKPAKWGVFTSEVEGIKYKSIVYMYIDYGQIFKFRGTARVANYNRYIGKFKNSIRSMRAEKP